MSFARNYDRNFPEMSAEVDYSETKEDETKRTIASNGGIGKHLLMKMGWKEGEGLGKNNEGLIEPIMPSPKFDFKGLRSKEEKIPSKKKIQLKPTVAAGSKSGGMSVSKDHPVALLQEFCMRERMRLPEYVMVTSTGPAHKPIFVMEVCVNNRWYRPPISASNKKQAKAMAAVEACQAFRLLPENFRDFKY
ncbi:Protein SON [Halotydeus destructor]|nr:Protein SON [Halotydeus destructor]